MHKGKFFVFGDHSYHIGIFLYWYSREVMKGSYCEAGAAALGPKVHTNLRFERTTQCSGEEEEPSAYSTLQVETKYYCYFLGLNHQSYGQTYNGYTVNLGRRLRQHNGEIKGGARATSGKAWHFIAYFHCPHWDNIRAMQVEWLCRYPTRKKPRPKQFGGSQGRIQSLGEICSRLDPVLDAGIVLYVLPEWMHFVPRDCIPDFVSIQPLA